ncbi:MAG: hypothetical protein ACFFD2_25845 [Promethearchaeota archaeon]
MDKLEKSEKSKEFHWKDYIKKAIRQPERAQIQEFIIYQKPGKQKNNYYIKKYEKTKEQNLEMLNLIQEILANTADLTPKQIIDYCNSQRYFMKLYFKQLQEKSK